MITNYPTDIRSFRLVILKHQLESLGYNVEILKNHFWGDYSLKLKIIRNPFILIIRLPLYIYFFIRFIHLVFFRKFDYIIFGYPVLFEIFFTSVFKRNKNNILSDYFLSYYDTLISDRKSFNANSILSKAIFNLDKMILRLSKRIIVDTNENADRFSKLFEIDIKKFNRIIVGSNLLTISDLKINSKKQTEYINIGWIGSFIPLQGFDTVLKTAELLCNNKYLFHIIGNSPDNQIKYYKMLAENSNINNIIFYGERMYEDALNLLSSCDICLGIFGESDKAKNVIPFKIFDYICLNKLIITQTSAVKNELLVFDNILFVENSPLKIAELIENINIGKIGIYVDYKRVLQSLYNGDLNKLFYVSD